jgi:hypothetical protein
MPAGERLGVRRHATAGGGGGTDARDARGEPVEIIYLETVAIHFARAKLRGSVFATATRVKILHRVFRLVVFHVPRERLCKVNAQRFEIERQSVQYLPGLENATVRVLEGRRYH